MYITKAVSREGNVRNICYVVGESQIIPKLKLFDGALASRTYGYHREFVICYWK